jgi:hypothetical protein
MWLTGEPDGPPRSPGWPLALAMDAAGRHFGVDGAALLGERAAHTGFARRGRVSPGGSCRLVEAADGWLAVNLARHSDVELLPAWIGVDTPAAVDRAVRTRTVADLDEGAALLGLPAAVLPAAPPAITDPIRVLDDAPARGHDGAPLVVDFSSLWAGPLCAQLLGLTGARVVKVESTTRPDGARFGRASFYDLLHGGHESVALPFADAAGRAALRVLVAAADVVIEASRPRALAQLGLDAHEAVAGGTTWVSITAYGRASGRVGFGDDAAIAAGLVAGRADAPLFCADAAADPVAGLFAAAAAARALAGSRAQLLDVSMRDCVAAAIGVTRDDERIGWEVDGVAVAPPRSRPVSATAPALGADTSRVLAELGVPAC